MRIYPNTTVDYEFQQLGSLGHSGSLNDRQFSFLRTSGYRGALADMLAQYLNFSPLNLYTASEPGVWLDPSDLTTLFQDDAGTTPVTAAGQSVGLVLDKSGRGNHATQSVFASRPLYQVDSGGRGYLSFDGVDDFLITPTITPGTDKVQVFAGVRKLSDAAIGTILESSANAGANNGALGFSAPGGFLDDFSFASRGTTQVSARFSVAAPATRVVTGLGDISGDIATLRLNGSQVAQTTSDQGSGNYLAYPIYIGRRGGTSLPFNGRLYGLITRFGPNMTDYLIGQTERWMAQRTGVVL